MDENKQMLYGIAVVIFLLLTGILQNLIESFEGNLIPVVIILCMCFLSYDFKFKRVRKNFLALTIFFIFILIDKLNSIVVKIGSYIIDSIPLLGFLLIYLTVYIILLDILKYKIILSRTYYLIGILILFVLRDKIKILDWVDESVLKILPGAGKNAIIFGLIIILIIEVLAYFIIWKRKSDKGVLEYG